MSISFKESSLAKAREPWILKPKLCGSAVCRSKSTVDCSDRCGKPVGIHSYCQCDEFEELALLTDLSYMFCGTKERRVAKRAGIGGVEDTEFWILAN
jgi:hypothetical protein